MQTGRADSIALASSAVPTNPRTEPRMTQANAFPDFIELLTHAAQGRQRLAAAAIDRPCSANGMLLRQV